MKTILFTSGILLLMAAGATATAQTGAELFRANCGYCHSIGKGDITGPDLKGSTSRHTEKWLVSWIKSSSAMIDAGDKTAVALYEKYNQISMPDQELDDNQIREIIAFIRSQSPEPAKQVAAAETKKDVPQAGASPEAPAAPVLLQKETAPAAAIPAAAPLAQNTVAGSVTFTYLFYASLVFILVLVILLFVMRNVIRSLSGELSRVYQSRR